MWTEKYRPTCLSEFDGPLYIKRFLENAMQSGHPHLLLYGPPGTGKTTIAMMLKPTLVLNASDERGIGVVREKIKKTASLLSPQVILLDECENLTKDSQTCMRRILEDYPSTTFIFCTNYKSRIIGPLQSRLLRLKIALKESDALSRIGSIEGLPFDSAFYATLFSHANNDLRKSTTVLQGLKPLLGSNNLMAAADNFLGRVDESVCSDFMNVTPQSFRKFVSNFLFSGYSVFHLINQLSDLDNGTDIEKCKFILCLSIAEENAYNGASDGLILTNLCIEKIRIFGS